MAYVRKTRDEFEIQQFTSYGWECVTTEDTWKNARVRLKEYRVNQPEYAARCIKHRVPIPA